MFKSKAIKAALAGAVALTIIGGSAAAASAATPAGSAGPLWLYDETATLKADGSSFAWTGIAVGSASNSAYDAPIHGSSDATGVKYFITTPGQETNNAQWLAWQTAGFDASGVDVSAPTFLLGQFNLGTQGAAALKISGGDFSLGVAFTKNAGNQLATAGVTFTHIHITAGTGAWTFETPSGPTAPDPCVTDPASCQNGQIDLEATTVAAADGALTLSVPAGAKATFSAATLVDHLSTSTATLPEITVTDDRVVTKKGWTLTSTVADFVSGSNTIAAKNLGVAPKVVATGTTSTGVTAAAAQVAGSAVFPSAAPFADAAAGSGVGVTKLSADLTLVAPADAPAGTYTSKMTLTLVSK